MMDMEGQEPSQRVIAAMKRLMETSHPKDEEDSRREALSRAYWEAINHLKAR